MFRWDAEHRFCLGSGVICATGSQQRLRTLSHPQDLGTAAVGKHRGVGSGDNSGLGKDALVPAGRGIFLGFGVQWDLALSPGFVASLLIYLFW